MSTLHITLPDELKDRVTARAAESSFASPEAYVESLVRADAGEDQFIDDDLEELLLRRLDDPTRIMLTPALVEQFKQEIAQRRKTSDVKP